MMDREVLETMAKTQEESLRFIAKDIETQARMLKKTPFEEEEKFQANLVQASFFLTAFTIAAKAFNAMINEKRVNPECDRKQADYLLDEVIKMQANEMDREKAEKEKNDE